MIESNFSANSLDNIVISMIDLKKIGKFYMDTCSCESVDTYTIKSTDAEGNCTCDTQTQEVKREHWCSCDDND